MGSGNPQHLERKNEELWTHPVSASCNQGDVGNRGAKSGGTGEPGPQKVNWHAESFGPRRENFETITAVYVYNDADYYVTDKDLIKIVTAENCAEFNLK